METCGSASIVVRLGNIAPKSECTARDTSRALHLIATSVGNPSDLEGRLLVTNQTSTG